MKQNKNVGSLFKSLVDAEEKIKPQLKMVMLEAREKRNLALLLKETRLKEGLTQKELAKMAGVSQEYIARLEPHPEAPSRLPTIDAYLRLLNSMGYCADIGLKKAA